MITNHLKDDTTSRYNSSGNVQNVKLSTERLFGVYCHGLFSSVNQKERWPWAGKSSEIKATSEAFSALKMPRDIPCTPHIVCLEVICWLQKSPKAGTRDLLTQPRTSSDGCTNKFPYFWQCCLFTTSIFWLNFVFYYHTVYGLQISEGI